MAGRYLLIEFDDPQSADALRARIDNATREGKRYRVVGMFAIPGPQFCECDTKVDTKTQRSTLQRGRKFGWWVCKVCKKPDSYMRLVNLIGVEEIIKPRIYRIINALTRKVDPMISYPMSIELPTRLYTRGKE